MTKELEEKYKAMLKNSIQNFFDIYDNYKNGFYITDVKDEKYKEAMLEAMNVMMMTVLKELED